MSAQEIANKFLKDLNYLATNNSPDILSKLATLCEIITILDNFTYLCRQSTCPSSLEKLLVKGFSIYCSYAVNSFDCYLDNGPFVFESPISQQKIKGDVTMEMAFFDAFYKIQNVISNNILKSSIVLDIYETSFHHSVSIFSVVAATMIESTSIQPNSLKASATQLLKMIIDEYTNSTLQVEINSAIDIKRLYYIFSCVLIIYDNSVLESMIMPLTDAHVALFQNLLYSLLTLSSIKDKVMCNYLDKACKLPENINSRINLASLSREKLSRSDVSNFKVCIDECLETCASLIVRMHGMLHLTTFFERGDNCSTIIKLVKCLKYAGATVCYSFISVGDSAVASAGAIDLPQFGLSYIQHNLCNANMLTCKDAAAWLFVVDELCDLECEKLFRLNPQPGEESSQSITESLLLAFDIIPKRRNRRCKRHAEHLEWKLSVLSTLNKCLEVHSNLAAKQDTDSDHVNIFLRIQRLPDTFKTTFCIRLANEVTNSYRVISESATQSESLVDNYQYLSQTLNALSTFIKYEKTWYSNAVAQPSIRELVLDSFQIQLDFACKSVSRSLIFDEDSDNFIVELNYFQLTIPIFIQVHPITIKSPIALKLCRNKISKLTKRVFFKWKTHVSCSVQALSCNTKGQTKFLSLQSHQQIALGCQQFILNLAEALELIGDHRSTTDESSLLSKLMKMEDLWTLLSVTNTSTLLELIQTKLTIP